MNFENLHKNHKFAFLDGLLCGVCVAFIGSAFINDIREERAYTKRLKEAAEAEVQLP